MSYERVTEGERNQIYALRQAGKGINEIARQLGRHKSTVSREVKRNAGQRYRPRQAHRKAVERAKRPGRGGSLKRFGATRRKLGGVVSRGDLQAGRVGGPRARARRRSTSTCTQTRRRAATFGRIWRAKRRRKRRCPRQEGRGRGVIPGRRGIETRPPEVGLRVVPGHWEGDLVAGAAGTGYLVTLVERVTRFALVGWVPTKEADVVSAEIIRLFRGIGVICTGITFDNGKEFAGHAEISCALELRDGVFFATPYHSGSGGRTRTRTG